MFEDVCLIDILFSIVNVRLIFCKFCFLSTCCEKLFHVYSFLFGNQKHLTGAASFPCGLDQLVISFVHPGLSGCEILTKRQFSILPILKIKRVWGCFLRGGLQCANPSLTKHQFLSSEVIILKWSFHENSSCLFLLRNWRGQSIRKSDKTISKRVVRHLKYEVY